MEVLGIDIGSYGIKGAIVDTEKGVIVSKKKTTDKIEDTRPHKLISKLHKVVKKFEWDGPIGCAFPAAVSNGVVLSCTRMDEGWVDADADHLFSEITGCDVRVINDTDATGLAEMTFGVGKGQKGTVIVLSVGTGIGSSLFVDGILVPNTELGMMEIKGISVEERASNKVRKEEGIRKKTWAKRLQLVLEHYEELFHPNLFILGGQLSKKADKTFPFIKIKTKFRGASFLNDASIVGAAYYAASVQVRDEEFFSPEN
ncbi:polyphosphate--glucose phosphotransferase [Balneola sp. MJW-20]|uniref:polyphosphate--glucose phosphotransferase n=1 Tax=Gracilimonas aurantiaca TaxID=3234185 RepID=UPI003465C83D